jgi:transposase
VHYSLVEMAKANGLKPDEYYRYIRERLPYAEAVEELESLLPWNVKAVLEKNSDYNK